jgi:hypothetical protein
MRVSKRLQGLGVAATGLVGCLLLAGCLSDNPGSGSLAYVRIGTHGVDAVRAETVRVFGDDGYRLATESAGSLAFEREATQRDRVLFGSYGDEQLSMRVVVSISAAPTGGCLVRADAYAVCPRVECRGWRGGPTRIC